MSRLTFSLFFSLLGLASDPMGTALAQNAVSLEFPSVVLAGEGFQGRIIIAKSPLAPVSGFLEAGVTGPSGVLLWVVKRQLTTHDFPEIIDSPLLLTTPLGSREQTIWIAAKFTPANGRVSVAFKPVKILPRHYIPWTIYGDHTLSCYDPYCHHNEDYYVDIVGILNPDHHWYFYGSIDFYACIADRYRHMDVYGEGHWYLGPSGLTLTLVAQDLIAPGVLIRSPGQPFPINGIFPFCD